MHTLHIELQEGFHDDRVVARLNGVEVLNMERVTTRMQTGFAAAASTPVPEGQATLEISLPAKGASGSVEIDFQEAVWAGVSVGPGQAIQFKISREPFGYV